MSERSFHRAAGLSVLGVAICLITIIPMQLTHGWPYAAEFCVRVLPTVLGMILIVWSLRQMDIHDPRP